MAQRQFRCGCGYTTVVPTQALGQSGRCPKCSTVSVLTLKNSTPVFAKEEEAPVTTAMRQTNCARCKRAFRGDWDIHQRAEGAICDICARQVGNLPPDTPPAPAAEREETMTPVQPGETITADDWHAMFSEVQAARNSTDPKAAWRSGTTQILLYIAGAALLVAGAITYILLATPQSIDSFNPEQPALLALLLVEQFTYGFMVHFVALFTLLWYLQRLPNERALLNAVSIGLVCMLLATVSLLRVNGYMGLMATIISFGLVKHLYDFDYWEFFLYALVRGGIGCMIMAVEYFLFGL